MEIIHCVYYKGKLWIENEGVYKPSCILSIHEENEENSFHEIFIDFIR